MNISIQQYRSRIGMHNRIKYKNRNALNCNLRLSQTVIFDRLCGLAPTAAISLKYILIIVSILNYFLDVFQEFIISNHSISSSSKTFINPNFNAAKMEYRTIISCVLYSIIYVMQEIMQFLYKSPDVKSFYRKIYFRLFYRKSLFSCIINVYSIWLLTINLILILLTIPNIMNPGPLNELNVLYHNIEGFVNLRDKSPIPQLFTSKVNDFHGHIFHEKPDIVILNETWLKSPVLDSEIFPNNSYKVFRRDRSNISHPLDNKYPNKYKKQGGGVVIAFRSDLDIETTEHKLSSSPAKAEILSVVLRSKAGTKICISTLYRVGTLGAENLCEVDRHLKSIAKSNSIHKHIFIGDINLSKTSWPNANSTCSIESGFLDLFYDLGFDQLINDPTHKDGNTLDLLCCNQPNIVSGIEILPRNSVCNSDHFAIKFKIKLNFKRLKSQKRRIYNMKKADFRSINDELFRVPWNNIIGNCNAELALDKFEHIFFSICDKFIPKVVTKPSFQPPWFDSELDGICKRKNKLLDKFKRTNDPSVYEEIKKLRKNFKNACSQKKRDNVINDDDPALIKKKFWSFFKSTSNSCRIPETMCYKSKFRSESTDVATLFNQYFSDQFSSPSSYDIDITFENDPFISKNFSEKSVFDLLIKVNANKAPGPDGFQSKMLKYCAKGLAKPLCLIFQTCFKTGCIPNKWKLANVVPVFKKGNKNSVENYRPISLTCLPMKIFEYLIRDMLMNKCKHLIKDNQHGFLPEKSCLTQLIPFTSDLSLALNSSSRIDAIYFDFAKAFDCVNHDLILNKLKHKFGIDGLLLQFVKAYLQDRKQQVLINGSVSKSLTVHSGVPQGSILGPLLFVLFIDDICEMVSQGTELVMYADDTKIWREITCDQDQCILQRDIDKLHEWSVNNKMKFHPDKCKVLAITNKSMTYPLPFYEHNYSMNGKLLDYVDSEKDLGVIITGKLSWNAHCEALVQKANQHLGLLRRTCYFIVDTKQRRVLYLSLIRSIFEHCCQVWAPYNLKSLNAFDLVQKRAVKWILKESYKSYTDNEYLRKQWSLDLLPMKYKFIFSDLTLFYKIVHNIVNISLPNYVSRIEPQDIKKITRNNKAMAEGTDNSKFRCSVMPKVNAFRYSFFVRVVNQWNELPLHVRAHDSTIKFTSALKEYLWLILGLKPD